MSTRRDFLQKMGLSALALTVVPRWVSPPSPEGRVLRVAIMGLGSYGTRVADAMRTCTRAKLVGAISGTPSKLKDWQSKYGIPEKNCYNYENFDAIKNNPDIDAVYVITPNALHKEEVIRVAIAGKHVICERSPAVRECNRWPGHGRCVQSCRGSNYWWVTGCISSPIPWRSSGCGRPESLAESAFFRASAASSSGRSCPMAPEQSPFGWRVPLWISGIYSVNGAAAI